MGENTGIITQYLKMNFILLKMEIGWKN